MNLNPFNSHLIKHPLNWLVVVAVAILGAMIIHHLMMGGSMLKRKMNAGKIAKRMPQNQGTAYAAAGNSGTHGQEDLLNGGAYGDVS